MSLTGDPGVLVLVHNFLGERQGAVVSPSPGWELAPAAPGTPLYAPGAPWAVPVHASMHAARVSGSAAVTPGCTRHPAG